MRRLVLLLVAALFAVTVGPTAAREGKAADAALHGYCPVAYVAMGKAMKGNPRISSVVDGRRFRFANGDAKKMFDADPSRYRVAYEGWCATAVAMGKKLESDPRLFTVHGGKTYLFSSVDAKRSFDAMPGDVIEKADAKWAALTAK